MMITRERFLDLVINFVSVRNNVLTQRGRCVNRQICLSLRALTLHTGMTAKTLVSRYGGEASDDMNIGIDGKFDEDNALSLYDDETSRPPKCLWYFLVKTKRT